MLRTASDVEDEVVVVPLERRDRRQHEVRVPGGLVEVGIDGDHEIQSGQRALESRPVRRREDGIAGQAHEGADLARPRRLHFLRQHRRRPLPTELGKTAHAAVALGEVAALSDPVAQGDEVDRGTREHGPARPVEVAGDGVEHVDEPVAHAAELLRRHADAAISDGGRRLRERARKGADLRGRDSRRLGHALRWELAHCRLNLLEPGEHRGQAAGIRAALAQHDLQQREEQEGIRPGADGQVRVGDGGRLRAAGIHHDQPAPTRAQRAQAPLDAGRGHEAPVGHEGIRSQHEQERRAVDIRHGEQELMPEHQERCQHVGELVDRGRGEAAARPQRAQQHLPVKDGAVVVDGRVALIDGDGVAAVGALHLDEPLRRQVEGGVPADLLPGRSAAAQGVPQPIGVLVQILQSDGLRTDVPVAEDVLLVAPDGKDAVPVDHDGQPAHRLAERAGPEVGGGGHGCRDGIANQRARRLHWSGGGRIS